MSAVGQTLNITIPAIGTAGTTYAANINDALTTIKTAIETAVPLSSLDVSADFFMAGFGVTGQLRAGFSGQTSAISASLTNSLYVLNNELRFIDGVGNDVQLTSGGLVGGSTAGIMGDYPGDPTADVTYSAINDIYDFLDAPGEWSTVRTGDLKLRGTAASPTTEITLKRPGTLSVSYDITFPTAVPAGASLVQMDAVGQLSTSNVLPAGTSTAGAGVKHGDRQISLGLPTAGVVTSGTGQFYWQGGVIGTLSLIADTGSVSGLVSVPIQVPVGARVKSVRATFSRGTSVSGSYTLYRAYQTFGTGACTALATNTFSTGTGTATTGFTLYTLTPTPYTVTAEDSIVFEIIANNAGTIQGFHLKSLSITIDWP